MSDTVISVENVSKAYRLGQIGGGTLKEDFSRWWAKLCRKPDPLLKIGEEHHARKMGEQFWALDGVSFGIKRGEVLGVIGRNGAGKSTLLKILSQVTMPTSGQIKIKGRIASLLEVGTGFHPELTGRENIFLNGAILGMTKTEIRKKFDEIVAFSGVEQFIDTPVKRYSSGMYVRLAFAVAAHLEPEILIVDEVLAVGDAEFQKKCLGKMEEVRKGGRTVLLVSHNMASVESLSTKVLLMNKGKVEAHDTTKKVLDSYQALLYSEAITATLAKRSDRSGTQLVRLTGFRVEDFAGNVLKTARSGQGIDLVFNYECPNSVPSGGVDMGFSIGYSDNQLLSVLYGSYIGQTLKGISKSGEFRWRIHKLALSEGRYVIGARVLVDQVEADWPRDGVGELLVEAGDFYGSGSRGHEAAPVLMNAELVLSRGTS